MPAASVESIVVESYATDVSSCGCELDSRFEIVVVRPKRGQQISSAANFAKGRQSRRAPESSLNLNHKTFGPLEIDMLSYEIEHGSRYDMFKSE